MFFFIVPLDRPIDVCVCARDTETGYYNIKPIIKARIIVHPRLTESTDVPEVAPAWPKGLLSPLPTEELVGPLLELDSVVDVPPAGVVVTESDGCMLGVEEEELDEDEDDEDDEDEELLDEDVGLESPDCVAKPIRALSKSKTV